MVFRRGRCWGRNSSHINDLDGIEGFVARFADDRKISERVGSVGSRETAAGLGLVGRVGREVTDRIQRSKVLYRAL